MTRLLAIVAILLWVGSAAFVGVKFVSGTTTPASDGREAIVLDEGEKDMVLAEMRGLLAAVQEVIRNVNAGDMDGVKAAAHRVGMAETEQVPPQTVLKLPLEFKQLGFSTHEGFDTVGVAADIGPEAVLEALADNMDRCVTCHETYRLTTQ